LVDLGEDALVLRVGGATLLAGKAGTGGFSGEGERLTSDKRLPEQTL
jgi:hypothetical protein